MLQIFFCNYVKVRKESISNRELVVRVSVADEAPRQLAAKENSYPLAGKELFRLIQTARALGANIYGGCLARSVPQEALEHVQGHGRRCSCGKRVA